MAVSTDVLQTQKCCNGMVSFLNYLNHSIFTLHKSTKDEFGTDLENIKVPSGMGFKKRKYRIIFIHINTLIGKPLTAKQLRELVPVKTIPQDVRKAGLLYHQFLQVFKIHLSPSSSFLLYFSNFSCLPPQTPIFPGLQWMFWGNQKMFNAENHAYSWALAAFLYQRWHCSWWF